VEEDRPVFGDLKVDEKFCWDHRKDKIDGWCAGCEHGLLQKISQTSYRSVDRPTENRSLWTGAEEWKVRRGTDECGGVSLCERCKTALYFEVRRVLFKKVKFCDGCVQKRAEEAAAADEQAKIQRFLRRLVDVVWQEATESEAVPSTDWSDRLIARAKQQDTDDPDDREIDLPGRGDRA
jgi:hypothetical protein